MKYEELNAIIPLEREAYDRIDQFSKLLSKWQKSINLVGDTTLDAIWERHILDGLQLIKFEKLFKEDAIFVDMGSGGGIPGLLLGLALNNTIYLQESDQRKCVFLKTVSRETSRNNVIVSEGRIEDTFIHNADVVFSRALSSLDMLLSRSFVQLSAGGQCFFHKGERYQEEIDEAKRNWNFTVDIYPSITNKKAAILHITQLEQKI